MLLQKYMHIFRTSWRVSAILSALAWALKQGNPSIPIRGFMGWILQIVFYRVALLVVIYGKEEVLPCIAPVFPEGWLHSVGQVVVVRLLASQPTSSED